MTKTVHNASIFNYYTLDIFFICLCNIFHCTAATVGYDQLIFLAREGEDEVEICLRITNLPNDGLECDVIVYLSAIDGAKTCTYE